MSVKLIRGGHPHLPWEFIGLVADTKPTENVPPGSTFEELDGNNVKSIFSGTTWYPVVERTALTGSLANLQGIVNTVTAGVRIPLSANQACSEVTITAKRLNTGYIYVGNASVSSTAYGIELEAKDSITIRVANLNQIYIDSSVNGEGVSYVAI